MEITNAEQDRKSVCVCGHPARLHHFTDPGPCSQCSCAVYTPKFESYPEGGWKDNEGPKERTLRLAQQKTIRMNRGDSATFSVECRIPRWRLLVAFFNPGYDGVVWATKRFDVEDISIYAGRPAVTLSYIEEIYTEGSYEKV